MNWGTKKGQKPGELEGKLTDFSNHISNMVKKYNEKRWVNFPLGNMAKFELED